MIRRLLFVAAVVVLLTCFVVMATEEPAHGLRSVPESLIR